MKTGAPRTPVAKRLLDRIEIVGDCWIFTGPTTSDGYGAIGVGRRKQLRAHRASFEEFVGHIPKGALVCHKCDTPRCINPEHLFLGTPKDNTQDMIKKGRMKHKTGEDHPLAKLSDVDVTSIKRLRAAGRTLAYIADRFGISFQHVSAISRGVYRRGKQ